MFTILAVRLLFLLIPGLIGMLIIQRFTRKTEEYYSIDRLLIYSFVLSAACYFITNFFFENSLIKSLSDFTKADISIQLSEVYATFIVSVILSWLYCLLKVKGHLFKLGIWLKMSNISGSGSSLRTILNSEVDGKDLSEHWAQIEFLEQKITYIGKIVDYTTEAVYTELVLTDVTLYEPNNKTTDFDALYVKIAPSDNVHLKFLPL